jgi:DNA-directed RNA polymerase subunit RPC12/RpoP
MATLDEYQAAESWRCPHCGTVDSPDAYRARNTRQLDGQLGTVCPSCGKPLLSPDTDAGREAASIAEHPDGSAIFHDGRLLLDLATGSIRPA